MRAIDANNDWMFGAGLNNYVSNQAYVAQDIKTRLQEWLGDCFYNINAGIDWGNLLGSKNQVGLNLAINCVLLNTDNVNGILQSSLSLNSNRQITLTYSVQTSYGVLNNQFVYDTATLV